MVNSAPLLSKDTAPDTALHAEGREEMPVKVLSSEAPMAASAAHVFERGLHDVLVCARMLEGKSAKATNAGLSHAPTESMSIKRDLLGEIREDMLSQVLR